MRPTPETDARAYIPSLGASTVSADFARKLERERDEAREELRTAVQERHDFHWELLDAIRERDEAREEWSKASMDAGQLLSEKTKVMAERDEAREALEDWENAAAHVEADHPDEVHCGCVPVLRKLLTDARKERDEAREALEEIEDRCVDCEDACNDIMKIREIAAKALEGAK